MLKRVTEMAFHFAASDLLERTWAQQNREIESNFKTRWKSLIRERYNISSTFSAHFCAYHSTGRITQRVAIVPWNVPKEGQVPSGFLARRRRRQHNAFSRHFTGSRHYSALRRRNLCILTTVFSNGFPAPPPPGQDSSSRAEEK